MCTVSIIRMGADLTRLACNRDEQRSRPVALPPRIECINGLCAVMPIDPTGGGTWIAANDAGVVMALLNRNTVTRTRSASGAAKKDHAAERGSARELVSRGRIIPSLMGCSSADDAMRSAAGIDASAYSPFTLVLVDRETRAQVISDGFQVRAVKLNPREDAALFTSSGLGDHLVEPPRRALFAAMMKGEGIHADTQDRFHRHRWADRDYLSVCMRRPDAATVSQTIIELGPEAIDFQYHASAPDEPGADYRTTISLLQPVGS